MAIRSRTAAMFSEIDIKAQTTKDTKLHEGIRTSLRGLRVPLRVFVVQYGRTNSVHEPKIYHGGTKGGHEGREGEQDRLERLVPVRGARLGGLRVPLRVFVVQYRRTNSVREPSVNLSVATSAAARPSS